jgi:DNA-binding PadR family transcriptional regulator
VLIALADAGPSTTADLDQVVLDHGVKMDQASLVRCIGRLERAGLVEARGGAAGTGRVFAVTRAGAVAATEPGTLTIPDESFQPSWGASKKHGLLGWLF